MRKPTAMRTKVAVMNAPSWQAPESLSKKLGRRLAELRTQRGWTQDQLADDRLAGLDRSYISDLERGVKEPGLDTMHRLAQAFSMSISDMVKGIDG